MNEPKHELFYANDDFLHAGQRYAGGHVYSFDVNNDNVEELGEAVEKVEFKGIEKIQYDVRNAVESYKKKVAELERNPYAKDADIYDYEVEKAKGELNAKIQKLEADYEAKVKELREDLTAQTLKRPKLTDDKKAEVDYAVDSAITSLELASYEAQKVDAINLLKAQVSVMDVEQRAAIAHHVPKLAKAADSENRQIKIDLQELYAEAQVSDIKASKARKQLKQLSAMTDGDYSPFTSYAQLTKVHKTFRKGRN